MEVPLGRLRSPRAYHPSRRRRDVHRALRQQMAERDKVGRPTRTLIGFAVCFVASLAVVVIATVVGQPSNYEPPLLNRTDQLVVTQWDPENPVRATSILNPDPTVSWDVKFSPIDPQPTVTLTWGGYDRFGPIYLFMDDKLASAIDFPCPGVSLARHVPGALQALVGEIDTSNSQTTRLSKVFTTDSSGATCTLKSDYSTSSNEPYVNVVTPNTIIARSDLTAPVTANDPAGKKLRPNQIRVAASTYPTDFRLDSIQASTNASEVNNGRLLWDTSDIGGGNEGQVQQVYEASFEQLELKFLSTQQNIDSGRTQFYSAIFLGLGLGVAAECMFRLLMDEHSNGDFWQYGPRQRVRTRNIMNGVIDGVAEAFRQLRRVRRLRQLRRPHDDD